jgi:hypothetical protein
MSIDGPNRSAVNDFIGKSESYVLPHGRGLRFKITDQPLQGEKNEANVLKTLATALGTSVSWEKAEPAENHKGHDGFVSISGYRISVQIVSVPTDPHFHRRVAAGHCEVDVSFDAAASWIVNAIRRKSTGPKCIAPSARAGLILALDARHAGQLVNPQVLNQLRRQMPELTALDFHSVWLVGSTGHGTRRLA